MTISIELTEEERMLAEDYSKRHSISMEEAFKTALFEEIEDDYDSIIGQESLAEVGGRRPINELWKECGLT